MLRLATAFAALVLPALALGAPPATAGRPRIAILEIRPLKTDPQLAELLSEVALTEAAATRRYDVIGRSDIAAVIGLEKQKAMLGCAEDSSCLAEIGGALGVNYLIVGSFGKIGTLFRLDLKLVDAKRARVMERYGQSVEGKEETLVAATQAGIRALLEAIPGAAAVAVTPSAAATPEPPKATPDLAPSPPPAARAVAVEPEPARGNASGPSRRTIGWVAGGAGVVALAGGAWFGLAARASYDDAKAATTNPAFDTKKSDVRRQALIADSLFAVGAVGVGVGGWFLFTGGPAVKAAVAPVPGGAVATVEGRF